MTGNRVNFEEVRQALRGLFDSGADSQRQRSRAAWWAVADAGDLHFQDFAEEEFGDYAMVMRTKASTAAPRGAGTIQGPSMSPATTPSTLGMATNGPITRRR